MRAAETLKVPIPIAPTGKLLTCLPRLLLAQLRPTLRSTTVCTCRRDFKSSHRPDGNIADVLGSTLACTTVNASVNYSMYVPQRPSKVPIAPMGQLLTCLPRFTLARLRTLRSTTTVCTCCRDLQKYPSPRWDFHMCCACACRAAVCTSTVAR